MAIKFNRPLRARTLLELAAGVALIGSAVGVALVDSSPRQATSAAERSPIQLGAADETRSVDHSNTKFRLQIPSLSIDAPIVAVDIEDDGVLGIPADPAEIGWWSGGPVPGSGQGTTILAGHVNTARLGPGALLDLETLRPGDEILVEGWGDPIAFEVESIVRHLRGELPAEAFDQRGTGRLAIVSCSDLNEETGQYRDNLIVYATPIST